MHNVERQTMTEITKDTRCIRHLMIVLLTSPICFLAMSGCSGAGNEFLGTWFNENYAMNVTKDADAFIVNVTRISTGEGLQGTYTAKRENRTLNFDMAVFGNARLSSDGMTIYWAGEEWRKLIENDIQSMTDSRDAVRDETQAAVHQAGRELSEAGAYNEYMYIGFGIALSALVLAILISVIKKRST